MPKKFKGENSKAVEARARKAAVVDAARAQKEKAAEDAYWADNNKSLQKKQQRKAEKDTKRAEALTRKKENQELYENEMEGIKSKKSAETKKTEKVTRSQINQQKEREEQERKAKETKKNLSNVTVPDDTLDENINRVVGDLIAKDGIVEARTVEDAITVLSVEDEIERHPERRMRAAYTKFEEENMPRLKKENPNMRLSQLKQMLKKDWLKSPENPMNQRFASYNTKK